MATNGPIHGCVPNHQVREKVVEKDRTVQVQVILRVVRPEVRQVPVVARIVRDREHLDTEESLEVEVLIEVDKQSHLQSSFQKEKQPTREQRS